MAQTEQHVNEEVKKAVRQFIVDTFLFGSEDEPFEDNDSFLEKGIIDSTGVLELIEFIEENYGINVEDEELVPDNFDSLDKVTAYINRKKG